MLSDNFKNKMKEMIIKNANRNIEKEDITDNTLLIEDLEYDSLSFINLIVDIENTFSVQFDSAYLLISNINQYINLANYVNKISEEKVNG